MTTNLESAYHMCQLAHPLLKASGIGSIVFISSVAGVVALNSGTIYAATKGNGDVINHLIILFLKIFAYVMLQNFLFTYTYSYGIYIFLIAL